MADDAGSNDHIAAIVVMDVRMMGKAHPVPANRVHMMYAKDGKSPQKARTKELLESALWMGTDMPVRTPRIGIRFVADPSFGRSDKSNSSRF